MGVRDSIKAGAASAINYTSEIIIIEKKMPKARMGLTFYLDINYI